MKSLDMVARILVVIGALNWGLIAIRPGFNLVALLLGAGVLAKIVYGLVGVAGLYELVMLFKK